MAVLDYPGLSYFKGKYDSQVEGILNDIVADEYSSSATYAVGDYVLHDGKLYICKTAIATAEEWTAAHWTEVDISGEVKDLKSSISDCDISSFRAPYTYSNLMDSSSWTLNSRVAPTNGATGNIDGYARTGYIVFDQPTLFRMLSSAYRICVWAYSGVTVGSALYAPYKNYDNSDILLPCKNGATRFRVGVYKIDETSMTSEDLATVLANLKTYVLADKTLSVQNVPADAATCGGIINGALLEKVNDSDYIVNSGIVATTGNITTTGNTYLTINHDFTNKDYFIADSLTGYVFGVYAWDGETYLGSFRNGAFAAASGTEMLTHFEFCRYPKSYIFRVGLKRSDGGTITSEEAINLLFSVNALGPDETLAIAGKAADSKVTGDKFKTALTSESGNAGVLPSGNLNDVVDVNKFYLLVSDNTYTNKPSDFPGAGFLEVVKIGNYNLQILYAFSTKKVWKRSGKTTWTDWLLISGITQTYNNSYSYPSYEETNAITVSPQITTDTNNYLASTGTQTDVSASIETLLTNNGVCNLGPGDFYVSGIYMPDNTALIGSGPNTRIILLGSMSDEGYAIHLGNGCSVEHMSILGRTSGGGTPENTEVINRHGILFEALYSSDESTKIRCNIHSCWINGFSGGGIACYNTGYGTNSSVNASDCWIFGCFAGIYVPYFSEFHRFCNISCRNCRYGAINNGGNCTFINCNFSTNKTGMLMDNSSGQSPNNSHGAVIGCIFDHEDSNAGIGIKAIGMTNGEIFSDCQLFYSDIDIESCAGFQFNNFNIGGSGVNIKVVKGTDGGLVLFNNCVFKDNSAGQTDAYSFTIDSGYTECKFVNCWTRNGTSVTGN